MAIFTGWYNADGLRWCSKCQAFMAPDLFQRNRASRAGDGLAHYCRLCTSAMRRQTYERNRAREIAYARDWQAAHPERARATARRANRVRYRLRLRTPQQVARMVERMEASHV